MYPRFQTLAMGSLFLVWLAVSWISVYPKSQAETKKLSVILKEGCKAASFQERILGQYKDWLRPRVIVTRTYAARRFSLLSARRRKSL